MPIREYRCDEGHTTEEIYGMGKEPAEIQCPMCELTATKIVSICASRIFGGCQTYDVKDVWEGTPLAGMGEPSLQEKNRKKHTWDRPTMTFDQSRTVKPGAGRNVKHGHGWEGAKAAMRETAKDAARKVHGSAQ
jgi:hypothetical protein